MSVRGIGQYWRRIEPGWKIINAAIVVIGVLSGAIAWTADIHNQASQVTGIQETLQAIHSDIQRIQRNQAVIASKLGIHIEDPKD